MATVTVSERSSTSAADLYCLPMSITDNLISVPQGRMLNKHVVPLNFWRAVRISSMYLFTISIIFHFPKARTSVDSRRLPFKEAAFLFAVKRRSATQGDRASSRCPPKKRFKLTGSRILLRFMRVHGLGSIKPSFLGSVPRLVGGLAGVVHKHSPFVALARTRFSCAHKHLRAHTRTQPINPYTYT